MLQSKSTLRTFKRKSNIAGNVKLFKYAQARKKDKWTFLLEALVRDKINFGLSTTTQYSYPFKFERLPKSFALEWAEKQALKAHYKVLRENTLEYLGKKAKKSSAQTVRENQDFPFSYQKIEFLTLFESRLDVCLWKAHFFSTLGEARQAIKAGHVSINTTKVKNYGRLLKAEEVISLSFGEEGDRKKRETLQETVFFQNYGQFEPFFKENLQNKNKTTKPLKFKRFVPPYLPKQGLYSPPAHLEIHYATLRFVFVGKPDAYALQWPYNIFVDKIKLKKSLLNFH